MEPVDRPTVLLELDPDITAGLKQALLRKVGGTDVNGIVIVAETDTAVAVLTADWVSPEVQAYMIKVAYGVVVDGKTT